MSSPKIAELRRMSDEDVIAKHDEIADQGQPGVSYYLDELFRRSQVRQGEIMLGYTRRIEWMTLLVTVATVVNVVISFLRR